MEELAEIDRELTGFERIQVQLATIATRDDDAPKRELVDLCRRSSAEIAEIGRIAEPFFACLQMRK